MSYSIVFLGTPLFAVPSLRALKADPRFNIELVITQPSRPVGRSKMMTPPPIKDEAERLGLPVFQTENLNRALDLLPLKHSFDFLVVVAFGQILSQAILDLPRIAPINVHASLLPRWRGASPMQHAIAAGDPETGVTIQRMVRELDAGDILAQERTAIDPTETTPTLMERLATLGGSLLVQTLSAKLHPVPQSTDGVTVCRTLSREDGLVDPMQSTAAEIERKIRAFTPWPGVTINLYGRSVKILEAHLASEPGTVDVLCRDATHLFVHTLKEAGRKPMSAADWMRGVR